MPVAILKDAKRPRAQVTGSGLHVVTRRPIAYHCRVCGTPFYEDEQVAYERHVIVCYREHEDEIRSTTLEETMPGLFGPNAGDVEKKDYYRRKGWRI